MSTTDKLHTAVSCKHLFTLLTLCMWAAVGFSQTDQCANAGDLPILFNGFMTGTLSPTAPADFSLATVEPGESFSPAVTAAGQTQKSVWYRFTLPTTRSVSIVLGQYGALMAPGDLGLTVYKTSSCLPADSLVSTRLSPLTDFDTTSSSCVEAGTYLVQVSGKSSANGLAYIQLILGQPAAAYDLTTQAYNFGTLTNGTQSVDYAVDCQSTEDITEFCTSLSNPAAYNKSSWQVFTTPSSFERIVFSVTPQTAPPGQVFGYRLYRGDVRISAVTVVTPCDSLTTGADDTARRSYTCGQLRGSTVYSVELFFRQDFRDNIDVSLTTTTPLVQNSNVTTCGSSYQLPWGQLVGTSGSYSDTIRAMAGCDSLIRNVQLLFANGSTAVVVQQFKDTICQGGSFALPWGPLVSTGGLYADTLRYLSGCDSVIRLEDLYIRTWNRDTVAVSLCGNQGYTLPGGTTVNSPGFYPDTLHYQNSSCDSLIRIFQISVALDSSTRDTVTLCSDTPYTLPWGPVVTTPGTYKDTARSLLGCDSLIRSITILVNEPLVKNVLASICPGQSYTLPSGRVVSLPGTYQDTLRALGGCDSLITHLDLSLLSSVHQDTTVTICAGQSYMLPWGPLVSTDSVYRDTLRTTSGCDSLVRSVTVRVNTLKVTSDTVINCSGLPYTLPWGMVVSTGGTFSDTTRSLGGCDSLIQHITVRINTPLINDVSASICASQSYTLPSGRVVSLPGQYQDTVRALAGCDSLVTRLDLSLITSLRRDTTVTICEGASYALPWGPVVTAEGQYKDTIRTTTGCDSLLLSLDLKIQKVTVKRDTVTVCAGQPYALPWGQMVTAPGTYRDTLRYASGCDSLVRSLTLAQTLSFTDSTSASFCTGSSYTLPWGMTVTTAGQYRDTIRTLAGCDSLIRLVDLRENGLTTLTDTASLCSRGSYTLPWGTVVTAPGLYTDTLKHQSGGCDSLVRRLVLLSNTPLYRDTAVFFCAGSTYTLPWGVDVATAGVYGDTLRYAAGCDSVIRSVHLRELAPAFRSLDTSICSGQAYTLPSGKTIQTAGIYQDTIPSSMGCDSLIWQVRLSIHSPVTISIDTLIYEGQNYTLPWGEVVSAAGVYTDTLPYTSGCDSLISIVHLAVNAVRWQTTAATICQGAGYTLPWGAVVFSAGPYRDTLRSAGGRDSLIREVILSVQTPQTLPQSLSVCGGSYRLPWGQIVYNSGSYSDTLPSTAGCDSLIRVIDLRMVSPVRETLAATICQGQSFTLPWGKVVTAGGLYADTLRSGAGCDSLIRSVDLTLSPAPMVRITKSNDINCQLGSATLSASGGARYAWSPGASLSDTTVYNPVATPTVSTLYRVRVSGPNGCDTEDSIWVAVNIADPEKGFLVPNAFTPDHDGLNDCFGIRHWGAVTDLHFSIYNRWGQLVFQTSNPADCWDGTYRNARLPSGTFVYLIRANTLCGRVERKGTVTLIR